MRTSLLLLISLALPATLSAQAPRDRGAERRLTLALQVLEASDFRSVLRIADSAFVAHSVQVNPQLGPYRDVFEEWSHHVYDWDVVGRGLASRMAERFTDAELNAILAFSRTPVGRKWARMR